MAGGLTIVYTETVFVYYSGLLGGLTWFQIAEPAFKGGAVQALNRKVTQSLQQEYGDRLEPFVADRWQHLPDLFSAEFGLPSEGPPRERLARLDEPVRLVHSMSTLARPTKVTQG